MARSDETAPAAVAARPAEEAVSSPAVESSLAGRFVAVLTPVFAVAAGWMAGVVAQAVPGAHLDHNQLVAFMIAAMTAVVTAAWKWLQGWQRHEQRVAEGKASPTSDRHKEAEA
ncbi:hypothetical protein [Nonomuraea lactucae]|uniref:hypothetical protein n=1 Tax=Nonomuraea lactucae TaxID=2249762 RepID=UPI0013B40C3D|nr:hypothetical protein [Nonomuraea lactucae]